MKNERSKTLSEAESLVNGRREHDYGSPQENYERIAALWSVIFGHDVTPEQVVLAMTQVKVSRLVKSPSHRDSWVDLAGYAALGSEVSRPRMPE